MRIPRYLKSAVAGALKKKMAFVGGPRQVGKTTFALGFLGSDSDETHPAYLNWDHPSVPPRLRLAPEWRPSRDSKTGSLIASGRLWDFTEKIAACRREGKNRRDGATVSTRVVKLTDVLGRKLFDDAILANSKGGAPPRLSSEEAKSLKKSLKEERRRRTLESRAHL